MRVRVDAAVLFLVLVFVPGLAHAQREFVEEVEQPKGSLDNVDLDAPDPADKKKKKKKPDEGAPDDKLPPDKRAPSPDDKLPVDKRAPTPDDKLPADKRPTPDDKRAPTPDDKRAPDTKPADDSKPESETGIRILETTYEAFLEKWDGRAATVRKGEVARARKQIVDIDNALLDFGVQGVPGGFQATAAATALLLEGQKALEDGDLEAAQSLVDAAARAAPDLVAVHTQNALVKWRQGDVGGTVNALGDAVRAHARDPLALSQTGARALALLCGVALVVLMLFTLLAGLPALRYLSFDLLQLLPKGAHGGQVLALVLMIGAAPLLVGVGPVIGPLWILTLAAVYFGPRERVIAFVLAVACVLMPLAFDAGSRLFAFPGSRADRAWRALADATAEPLRRALAKRPPADLNAMEQAALALAAKREGRIDDAAKRFEALTLQHPELSYAHADYGVTAALLGHEEQALSELGKALAADQNTYAAAFDVSVLHYRAGRTEKAQSAVAPVAKAAPLLLNQYRRTTFRAPDQVVGHNRALVDVYPDPGWVLSEATAPSAESAAVSDNIARVMLRGQAGTRALGLLAAFPVVWALLIAARRKIAPARACVRCGDPASRRVDGKDVPEDTCSACFHAFVSTRSRVDAGVKLRKERQIMQRRTRIGRTVLVLGIAFPGAGHFYGGAPVRGFAFASIHSLALGALVFALGILPMPRLEGPWGRGPFIVILALVIVVDWLVSLRSSWLLAEEASGKGRR